MQKRVKLNTYQDQFAKVCIKCISLSW